MSREVKRLKGWKILSLDDYSGSIENSFFSNKSGITLYCDIETGNWLIKHKSQISPFLLNPINTKKNPLKSISTQSQPDHDIFSYYGSESTPTCLPSDDLTQVIAQDYPLAAEDREQTQWR